MSMEIVMILIQMMMSIELLIYEIILSIFCLNMAEQSSWVADFKSTIVLFKLIRIQQNLV